MSHILRIQPIGAYHDEMVHDGSLVSWVGTFAKVSQNTSLEKLRQVSTLPEQWIATGYQVLANGDDTSPRVLNIIVNTPIHQDVFVENPNDPKGEFVKVSKTVFQRYSTDVTPEEYAAAVSKAAKENNPIVDITREGLRSIRAKAAEPAPSGTR